MPGRGHVGNRAAVIQALRQQSVMSTPIRAMLWIIQRRSRAIRGGLKAGWVGRIPDSGRRVRALGKKVDRIHIYVRRRSVPGSSDTRTRCAPSIGVAAARDGGGLIHSIPAQAVDAVGRRSVCGPANRTWHGCLPVICRTRDIPKDRAVRLSMRHAIRHARHHRATQAGSCRVLGRGDIRGNAERPRQ